MQLLRFILKALGLYKPQTVEQIIAPLKSTMEDLKSAVADRKEAVKENEKQIEELLYENTTHANEIERAGRVATNIENLLN